MNKDGYLGFTFNGHHSSEFNILVVSDSNRYHQNFYNNFNDDTLTVAGYKGSYYFGTNIANREINIKCAFDNLTAHDRNKIQKWLYPNKIGWLIFDECPYKKYYVKISSIPTFDFLPFNNDYKHNEISIHREQLKGELSIQFYSMIEYAIYNEKYEGSNFPSGIHEWDIECGVIPHGYTHDNILTPNERKETVFENTVLNIYNAGNGDSSATFSFNISGDTITENSPLEIYNMDTGESSIIHEFSKLTKKKILPDHSYNEIVYYQIVIDGRKKEIWAYGLNENEENITDKINIGSVFNQYYPHIVSISPTEIVIVKQNEGEEIIYSSLYDIEDYNPSDMKKGNYKRFEGFLERYSGYEVCSPDKNISVDNLLNPLMLFTNNNNEEQEIPDNTIVYLVRPDKFMINKTINNFSADYNYTYI